MSSSHQQTHAAQEIRDEVRRTIQQLTELARTEKDFDQFSETVLSNIVKITGAHGAILWQIDPQRGLSQSHQFGKYPHQAAREITSAENDRHTGAIVEVVRKKLPMGISSEAFTGNDSSEPLEQRPTPFILLFAPLLDRQQNARGALELLQRGDISPQAQEGYLRFLNQVAQLFQRWNEHQDLARLSEDVDQWQERMKFISETHRSIDPTETAYAIANEARRLLKCDRVSVGKWNGSRCKIVAISSQDRFDNRSNVVRLLSNVATASVSAETPFWITGDTEGMAPEVAGKINEYLDEAHSRTLAVIPLLCKPPQLPDLEMRSRRREKARKLGVIVFEYFDRDVPETTVEDDCKLIVEQSELAMENSRKHSEIFLQPVWKRLGWLQQVLFRDHYAKTMTALGALLLITLLLIFCPRELTMKVDGVMQPAMRKTIFSPAQAQIVEVKFDRLNEVEPDQELLQLRDPMLEQSIERIQSDINRQTEEFKNASSALSREKDPVRQQEFAANRMMAQAAIDSLENQKRILVRERDKLDLRSPIQGTVLTARRISDLQDLPVSPSEPLLTVADLKGAWHLELKIPEGRVGYVQQAMQASDEDLIVEFMIGSNPNDSLTGRLIYVSPRAVSSQEGVPEFRATVLIDADQLEGREDELYSGVGATAHIRCGQTSLGFTLFFQVYDFFRTTVFF